MKPAYELAEVIARFGTSFRHTCNPNAYVERVLRAISICRTSELGGHIDRCSECGHIRVSYNSCRNRHCPKCQNTQREAWIQNRRDALLPVTCFHVVFTVPDTLNGLFLYNPPAMYNLLFRTAWDTVSQFFATRMHVESGMTAILHTWGQSLAFHPHLHCIVPGGGLSVKGEWKQSRISANSKMFLFPVEQLSVVFRAKFMEALQRLTNIGSSLRHDLYGHKWVVYTKEPFAGPDAIIEYLGRYSHKVAISNHRILGVDESGVTFRWLDYRDNKQKVMRLDGVEFLRRFAMHILPKGFVRIRHFGLMSAVHNKRLEGIRLFSGQAETREDSKDWKSICRAHLNFDPDLCPRCGKGEMILIEKLKPGRPPPMLVWEG